MMGTFIMPHRSVAKVSPFYRLHDVEKVAVLTLSMATMTT
jgi:hypothetical protein